MDISLDQNPGVGVGRGGGLNAFTGMNDSPYIYFFTLCYQNIRHYSYFVGMRVVQKEIYAMSVEMV